MDYELIIFDLDGTLAPFDSDTLYPDAEAWLKAAGEQQWVIATNQGGIGLRYWMEHDGFGDPSKYPTLQSFYARLDKLFSTVALQHEVLMCPRYQSKKSGAWCPVPETDNLDMWRTDWRKPERGMLDRAMSMALVYPQETLMVGDGDEDKGAAAAAGCAFKYAWEFFGREMPVAKDNQ